ncbi:MAG: ABC transporter permease [Planctomycetota bacterium]|jgi:putative ABC transport system permease protein
MMTDADPGAMFGVIEIAPWQLALSTGFILVAAALSLALSLGFFRSLIVAMVRTYLQLFVLGFALRWIFGINETFLVLAVLAIMMLLGAQTALARAKGAPGGLYFRVFNAVFLSGVSVTFAVTAVIIQVEPWYEARYVIPIAGMVVGNSMTGLSLGIERLFSDLNKRSHEVHVLLSLGASPWEASLASIRTALRASLIPTINSMSTVGIVFIPGMMTGQILAGVDPAQAARYQIVVMLMISAATALSCLVAVISTFRRAFDKDACFVLPQSTGSD